MLPLDAVADAETVVLVCVQVRTLEDDAETVAVLMLEVTVTLAVRPEDIEIATEGGIASGAVRERLLPASVPFRFFAAAGVFHVVAWIALLEASDDLAGQGGGLGPGLAALHLI